jgi:hypothetical protein
MQWLAIALRCAVLVRLMRISLFRHTRGRKRQVLRVGARRHSHGTDDVEVLFVLSLHECLDNVIRILIVLCSSLFNRLNFLLSGSHIGGN